MTAPTAEEIQGWSKVDFAELGWDDLQILVDRAVEYVEAVTGQTFASMPSTLEKTAARVVQMVVEQQSFRTQEDLIETAADFDLIANFSVAGYSETRRSADDALKLSRVINSWPELNSLLWGMATDDKKDEWLDLWSGKNAPAFEVTEVDWSDSELPESVYWPGA